MRFPVLTPASSAAVSNPMTAAISLDSVDVTFPGEDGPVKALSSIDLRVEKQ